MYDGWTSTTSEHFVGLFLSYCMSTTGYDKGKVCTFWALHMVLLFCANLEHCKKIEGDEVSIQMSAEKHVEIIKDSLDYFKISLDDKFITNQICDNSAVSKKIGDILGIYSVGCNSHKLNLEVEKFVINSESCMNLITSVRKTIAALHNQRFRSLLRNNPDLYVPWPNDTSCYGRHQLLKCWLDWYEICISFNHQSRLENCEQKKLIPIDLHLKAEVEKYASFFEFIDGIFLELEKNLVSLADCRNHMDKLEARCQAPVVNNTLDGLFHELVPCYITESAGIVKDVHFEKGVVKIQQKEPHLLSLEEKNAVDCLLGTDSPANVHSSDATEEYINCDYIFGSVACIEKIGCMTNHVLGEKESNYYENPCSIEDILFLHVNKNFWDINTVNEAFQTLKNTGNANNQLP